MKKLPLILFTTFSLTLSLPNLAAIQTTIPASVQEKLAALETQSGGRLGIAAINTANNNRILYRAEEHFPMGCTSKVLGVGAILKLSMKDNKLLQQRITYTENDLAGWSPITKNHIAEGMTIFDLSAAAITRSDNTAMNLLTQKLGGPQGITRFARSMGDKQARQDHLWPEEANSGGKDLSDSSTPQAMEKSLQALTLGKVLAPFQRELLLTWLKANTTGSARIRAGVPEGWIVGDKTGTGAYYGTTNDIGLIWPPKQAPIVLVVFFTQDNKKLASKREDVIAAATRIVLNEFVPEALKRSS
jgi:beta-lactamase class A